MDKFTASNGIEFQAEGGNAPLLWRSPGDPLGSEAWIPVGHPLQDDGMYGFTLRSMIADALREFFAHERDVELGRWRDLERGNYVVYDLGGTLKGQPRVARVLDERSGFHLDVVDRDDWDDTPFHAGEFAARAYFAAHPEPKPWHDAKPGEVWVITTENVANEVAVQRTPAGAWQYNDGRVFADHGIEIATARRIFPEVSDD